MARTHRVKHSRDELRALKRLDSALSYVGAGTDAGTILLAAVLTLKYNYPSDRERVFKETLSVLSSPEAQ